MTCYGKLTDAVKYRLRAFDAATDKVGLFFGEDVFVALVASVLMVTFLKASEIINAPARVTLLGLPTPLAPFLSHSMRLYLLPRAGQATQANGIARRRHRSGNRRQRMTFSIEYLFWLLGVLLIVVGAIILRDRSHPRRASAGGFWIFYGLVFLAGNLVPLWTVGVVVLLLALVAGFGGVTGARPVMRPKLNAIRLGNKLFFPALIISPVTVSDKLLAPYLCSAANRCSIRMRSNLVAFGIGCIVALAAACVITHDTVMQSIRETRHLLDALSWAVVLPQMLGLLGLVLPAAGAGAAVSHVSTAYIAISTIASWP